MAAMQAAAGLELWPGAVAVSGGGDSLALMHLLADWARARKKAPPLVLCVDHGLRPQSRKDALRVARWAGAARLPCEILAVPGKKPAADIEAWARDSRYSLMGDALRRHGLAALYVGHSLDDQAETFLLRLARGSGLDGLSAMRPVASWPVRGFGGLCVARPLLGIGRQALREELTARRQDWLEDPMNGQARFARTRIRALMPALAQAGLSAPRIADAAAHLARVREALDLATAALLARAIARQSKSPGGQQAGLLLDPLVLADAPREIGLRALAALLGQVSGAPYRPRFESLERLFDRITAGELGKGATLHGCRIGAAPRRIQAFGPQTLVIAKESVRSRG